MGFGAVRTHGVSITRMAVYGAAPDEVWWGAQNWCNILRGWRFVVLGAKNFSPLRLFVAFGGGFCTGSGS
jgi:hypothetical protein